MAGLRPLGWVLIGHDQATTVLYRTSLRQAYTPFGANPSAFASSYIGLQHEPFGGYLPGNGRRLYLPSIMRCCQADVLSPFSRGGVNAYAYCSADPINRRDPSGESALWLLGNLFGTLNLGAYGAVMAASYRLAKPSRMVLAVDVSLMAAGATAQTVSWATREDSAQIASIGATAVTVLGRTALAGSLWHKVRAPVREPLEMISYTRT